MTAVQLLLVRSGAEKLEAVTSVVADHFHRGARLLILVENPEAAQFVDDLLWRLPPDSFLPHSIAEGAVDLPVVITRRHENLNRATVLVSLVPIVSPIATQFSLVVDLDDQTSPQKRALSAERKRAYEAMGLTLDNS